MSKKKHFESMDGILLSDQPSPALLDYANERRLLIITLLEAPESQNELQFIADYLEARQLEIHPRFCIYFYPKGQDRELAEALVLEQLLEEYELWKKLRKKSGAFLH